MTCTGLGFDFKQLRSFFFGLSDSFGIEPQPDDALPEEYPFEVFRRVVLLPGGRESDPLDLFAGVVSETKSSLSKP